VGLVYSLQNQAAAPSKLNLWESLHALNGGGAQDGIVGGSAGATVGTVGGAAVVVVGGGLAVPASDHFLGLLFSVTPFQIALMPYWRSQLAVSTRYFFALAATLPLLTSNGIVS